MTLASKIVFNASGKLVYFLSKHKYVVKTQHH